LDKERLVDGLVAHLHLRPVWVKVSEPVTDLFGAPPHHQLALYELGQFDVVELRALGTPASDLGLLLRRVGGVLPSALL
jgi:hypothetical protein